MIRKKKINKNVVYILSLLLLLFIGYGIYEFYNGQMEKKRASEEISKKMVTNKKYESLEIKGIRINKLEKQVYLNAQIKNEADSFYFSESVNFVFLDEKGKVVCSIPTVLPDIESKATSNIEVLIEEKCKNSYTFVIEKIEKEGNNKYE